MRNSFRFDSRFLPLYVRRLFTGDPLQEALYRRPFTVGSLQEALYRRPFTGGPLQEALYRRPSSSQSPEDTATVTRVVVNAMRENVQPGTQWRSQNAKRLGEAGWGSSMLYIMTNSS